MLTIAAARPDAIRFTSVAIWDGVCIPHADRATAGTKAAAPNKIQRFMTGIASGLRLRLLRSGGIDVPRFANIEGNEVHDGVEGPVRAVCIGSRTREYRRKSSANRDGGCDVGQYRGSTGNGR
jgi:hypothetical protein